MFENFRKKSWIISGLFILFLLNIAAFYILKKGIGISDALEHAENETMKISLQKQDIFSDFFPAIVFTLDIFAVLILLILFLKFIFKSLKKSTSTK